MKKEELYRRIDLRPEDPFVWFNGPPVLEEIPWGDVGVNRRKLAKIRREAAAETHEYGSAAKAYVGWIGL